MIGYVAVKRTIKRTAGWGAWLLDTLPGRPTPEQGCILMYHRVAKIDFCDLSVDDFNVPPHRFERQIAALAEFAEVVPLRDLPGRLASQSSNRPVVALTFDDGYANFYTEALPILRRYDVPATVFVVTGAVGEKRPLAHDIWSRKNVHRVHVDTWRSMTWPEMEACLDSGLVEIGSHSHRHFKGVDCTFEQLVEETQISRSILRQRLNETQGRIYSYPYGSRRLGFVSPDYVGAVRSAGYEMAVCSELGLVCPESDCYLLPRIESHEVDTAGVLRAKARGALGPYYFVQRLRSTKHID